MITLKASLVRAVYDWAVDNQFTPYLEAAADFPGIEVPPRAVDQGRVVLNIHPNAVRDLALGDEFLTFSARFSGTPFAVTIPVLAITALYARENGEGISFAPPVNPSGPPDAPPTTGRPALKVVK